MNHSLKDVIEYHQTTKHSFQRYARGPGYLDWATQPDPFRRYHGAPLLKLERTPQLPDPPYDAAVVWGRIAPARVDIQSISALFFNSLALSAWKSAGGQSWALRVNPSSGNLHPTEGYLVSGPVPGLCEQACIFHYAPREHGLEQRAVIPEPLWDRMRSRLPAGSFLIGLSSIHWRESWKYGERAYRYCQLDVGHAVAAVSLAASGLGWKALILDCPGTDAVGSFLGISRMVGPEREHPDTLILIVPDAEGTLGDLVPEPPPKSEWDGLNWQGEPNQLSRAHVHWEIIDTVARACRKPACTSTHGISSLAGLSLPGTTRQHPLLSEIVRQRRSAVSMDGTTHMPASTFFHILSRTLPGPNAVPHATLLWSPRVHLALFVHRVEGLSPGLYLLIRRAECRQSLEDAMHANFPWRRPEACPDGIDLYQLMEGDLRQTAMQVACHQDIAADGCFSVAMMAEFDDPLRSIGSWFYPRLFWECGSIGQVLYLEAEAAGLRATGIGCFFDDPMHELLGMKSTRYQNLYQLTVGGPVEDSRLTTLPAYAG
jgi:SagB-type dehydrogenase family enzyme